MRNTQSEQVRLDFYPDRAAIERARRSVLLTKDAEELAYDFFEMPVRIEIGGMDMLRCNQRSHDRIPGLPSPDDTLAASHQPCPWVSLPIIHVATAGLFKLHEVNRYPSASEYYIPYSKHLHFVRCMADVLVHSDLTERTARVLYTDLVSDWQDFADRVRRYILEELPELAEHPVMIERWR
jgi:hypothetical protein